MMLTAEQIREIRAAATPAQGPPFILWGLGALLAICLALGTFELNRISATVERVETRQLTQMLPGLTRVEARLESFRQICCSEIDHDGKVHADVMIDDDPPKPKGGK